MRPAVRNTAITISLALVALAPVAASARPVLDPPVTNNPTGYASPAVHPTPDQQVIVVHHQTAIPPVLKPVKPCTRCSIPDIDPTSGVSSPEVGAVLRSYRSNDAMNGAITFAMNAIVLEGLDTTLRVGQDVTANWSFD